MVSGVSVPKENYNHVWEGTGSAVVGILHMTRLQWQRLYSNRELVANSKSV